MRRVCVTVCFVCIYTRVCVWLCCVVFPACANALCACGSNPVVRLWRTCQAKPKPGERVGQTCALEVEVEKQQQQQLQRLQLRRQPTGETKRKLVSLPKLKLSFSRHFPCVCVCVEKWLEEAADRCVFCVLGASAGTQQVCCLSLLFCCLCFCCTSTRLCSQLINLLTILKIVQTQ